MHIKPLYDNIVLERESAPGTSKGGIILPDAAKEPPRTGTVLAVGPGRWKDGHLQIVPFEVGDRILYRPYGVNDFKVDDTNYFILNAAEVLAVIDTKVLEEVKA